MNYSNFFKSSCVRIFILLVVLSTSAFSTDAQQHKQAEVVAVKSASMKRAINCTVILPEQYFDDDEQDGQFPVLYLLNGYGGDHTVWYKNRPDLPEVASNYGIIIVCPDGQDSWYFDSPIDPKMKFETFMTTELITYIDEHYRTFPEGKMRAITGLSMGGHGSLWLAFRHPNLYGACGTMSGGVDIRPFPNNWKIKERLGEESANEEVWNAHTVISLVPQLQNGNQRIIVDCGVADFFSQVNRNLHEALLKQGIDHDYVERPGGHTWSYWCNALDYHVMFLTKAFENQEAK